MVFQVTKKNNNMIDNKINNLINDLIEIADKAAKKYGANSKNFEEHVKNKIKLHDAKLELERYEQCIVNANRLIQYLTEDPTIKVEDLKYNALEIKVRLALLSNKIK